MDTEKIREMRFVSVMCLIIATAFAVYGAMGCGSENTTKTTGGTVEGKLTKTRDVGHEDMDRRRIEKRRKTARATTLGQAVSIDWKLDGLGDFIGDNSGNPIKGNAPKVIAIGGGPTVVEMHQSISSDDYKYTVGAASTGGTIDWGETQGVGDSGSNMFDIAGFTSGKVVQIHEASGSSDELYYSVGDVQPGNTISWGGSQDAGTTGTSPAIAVADRGNSNTVIAIHEASGATSNELWYQIGTINRLDTGAKTVDWGGSQDVGTSGADPTIATASKGFMHLVIEVHRTTGGSGTGEDALWYTVGVINGGTIDWRGTQRIPLSEGGTDNTGAMPEITVVDNETVVLTYNSQIWTTKGGYERLGGYQTGTIREDFTVTWSNSGGVLGVVPTSNGGGISALDASQFGPSVVTVASDDGFFSSLDRTLDLSYNTGQIS